MLPAERAKATFRTERLTEILYGGPQAVARRKFIQGPIEPLIPNPSAKYELSRAESLRYGVKHFIDIHLPFTKRGYKITGTELGTMSESATFTSSMMPGFLLGLPTLFGMASEEQLAVWLPRVMTFGIVIAYSQTELSHGSNVRGLHTTAVYDETAQEFVVNTPTLGSMKWWNSGCGLVATHTCLFAQLILGGREYGVHPFFVQLRDENFEMLPGVEVGDVGTKLGDNAMDTAYIRLENVRVPRVHLLAKRQHVEPNGTYVKHTSPKAEGSDLGHYTTMVRARAGTVTLCSGKLAIAATVAARYSCVRQQGFVAADSQSFSSTPENAVIEYQTQRFRILRAIATSYAMRATSYFMVDLMSSFAKDVAAGGAIQNLAEIHATASGLKGYCTRITADAIEDCRRCCGGHGYLLNSGVAALAADFVWVGTAEGDFFVLLLQCARYLLKAYSAALRGQPMHGALAAAMAPFKDPAFNPLSLVPRKPHTSAEAVELGYLSALLRARTLTAVKRVGDRFEELMKKPGSVFETVFNDCALELTDAAQLHVSSFIFEQFYKFVLSASASHDAPIQAVLRRLCALYGAADVSKGSAWAGVLDGNTVVLIDRAISLLLDELRPDVVALVDAFAIPDEVLNSTLGRYDGNVYEALYEAARDSPLNKQQPFDGFIESLAPLLDKEFMALRGKAHPSLAKKKGVSDNTSEVGSRL